MRRRPFFTRRHSVAVAPLFAAALVLIGTGSALADPGPLLTVDVGEDRHPISDLIYGLNSYGVDAQFARELHVSVSRWGGDATTRYNWRVDASNAGADWFFIAGAGKPSHVPGAGADAFIDTNRADGARTLLTIPVIDYINRSEGYDCSFPVSLLGPQQQVNPYVHPIVNGSPTDAGNGKTPDGKDIVLTRDQILRTHVVNTPELQGGWLRHLVEKYGTAAHGGVSIYQMDNEPGGWSNTHRDVHPLTPTYPEIVAKTIPFAAMVKATDPTAAVDGPGDFGWAVYKGDPGELGGLWNAEYYLQEMARYGKAHGVRILDYFDEHYYPESDDGTGKLANVAAGDAATQALRLRSTRSLWDPTYVEKNWIGKWNGTIELIPRMHRWVDQYYPGTKTAITEYNWGGVESINGALAEADVLGIFGRERLDMATMWGPPNVTDPAAFAFRMYRNYDGAGARFGDVGVRAASADQDSLAVYAAERGTDGVLTLIVVNKTAAPCASAVHVVGFKFAGAPARVYQYSAGNPHAIVRQPDQPLNPYGFRATFPPDSITLVAIAGRR